MRSATIGVIGASGLVGQEILGWLQRFRYPLESVRALASERSAGRRLSIGSWDWEVEALTEERLEGLDLALFATEAEVSRHWIPVAHRHGVRCIDSSSAFRQDPSVPLLIPEINGEQLASHPSLVASPNCSATLALLALAPLHRAFGLKSFSACTYQAVSGVGRDGLRALAQERANSEKFSEIFSDRIEQNILATIGEIQPNGFAAEEEKMVHESRKILDLPELGVVATCVRVPVERAHSLAIQAHFAEPVDLAAAEDALRHAKSLRYTPEWLPTPLRCARNEDCYVSRLRLVPPRAGDHDETQVIDSHDLLLWVVGDQLWSGAALNVVRLVNLLLRDCFPHNLNSSPLKLQI
ncbi:MAG: aspartate-semialdehyde dehydrogenase [Puniceicoccales bacterium]|jgi:aspartate-semialdehyde dehydrogenase|nr:aspartate-semialdehyde dehydrogenase [Puniceicoccales bacterium]